MMGDLSFLAHGAIVFALAFGITAAWMQHVQQIDRERVELEWRVG